MHKAWCNAGAAALTAPVPGVKTTKRQVPTHQHAHNRRKQVPQGDNMDALRMHLASHDCIRELAFPEAATGQTPLADTLVDGHDAATAVLLHYML